MSFFCTIFGDEYFDEYTYTVVGKNKMYIMKEHKDNILNIWHKLDRFKWDLFVTSSDSTNQRELFALNFETAMNNNSYKQWKVMKKGIGLALQYSVSRNIFC